MNYRKTVKNELKITGIGLHSGKKVTLCVHPAESGTGIVFLYKKSNHHTIRIPAILSNVVDTSNAVTIGDGLHTIQTIEHLMAALYTMGITDTVIEIDSVEIPILDGSSLPFIEAFRSIGVSEFKETIEPIKIQNPIWVVDGDKYIVVLPSDELKVSYQIDFKHPLLKGQNYTTVLNSDILEKDILPARTFGFLRDAEAMKAKGLAMGGSIDNAIVLTDDGYLNESLRFDNECVRHKILDLIGDISIVGRPVIGHFLASKAGHALDITLGKLILSKVTGDELKTFKSKRYSFSERIRLRSVG